VTSLAWRHGGIRDFLPIDERPGGDLPRRDPVVPAPRLSERVGHRCGSSGRRGNPIRQLQGPDKTMAILHGGGGGAVLGDGKQSGVGRRGVRVAGGLECVVLIPDGPHRTGQAGAGVDARPRSCKCGETSDQLLTLCATCRTRAITVVNSVNPHRIEGQMTRFEIFGRPARRPTSIASRGQRREYLGLLARLPQVQGCREVDQAAAHAGFQAAGAAPIVLGHPWRTPRRSPPPSAWESASWYSATAPPRVRRFHHGGHRRRDHGAYTFLASRSPFSVRRRRRPRGRIAQVRRARRLTVVVWLTGTG